MPRKLIKRYLPHPHSIKGNRYLSFLGHRIHDPNLWHLNRRSAAAAFFVGIFCAFLPIPFQMVAAATLAVIVRCNLPLSVALVWITNPLTMPAIFYFTYKVGCYLLDTPIREVPFEMTPQWVEGELSAIWEPLLAGSMLTGLLLGAFCYFVIRFYWRWSVGRSWRARQMRRSRNTDTKE
ncbi:DUF2062 domain-containing protein [Aestuariirhabdus litorea]|uniref:DUF2062 domain-containing protein n=1 Tax=Aestuariirhabdus litorea TaxID=2528527 RepID=A0A3P3VU00_9GAMM|nr:DUF2062 domain-containing protein [Aestuariirhabdus litorea]RRJ85458.1 DUF2062 domain-containing protein [Aestuariirhabdus litorea]RWW97904.1 DUF2062 domain-containing protein [Endozoicomonadaceae bacterium GTF-13]